MRDNKFRAATPVGTRAHKSSPDGTRIVTRDIALAEVRVGGRSLRQGKRHPRRRKGGGSLGKEPGWAFTQRLEPGAARASITNFWTQDLFSLAGFQPDSTGEHAGRPRRSRVEKRGAPSCANRRAPASEFLGELYNADRDNVDASTKNQARNR